MVLVVKKQGYRKIARGGDGRIKVSGRRRSGDGRCGRRFVVRAASVVAAFAVCFVGGALSVRASGIQRSSMSVEVLSGPAHAAGLRDGDRILSIDGKPYDDFEAMRADIQASQGPRSMTFERNGERITREVDPMPERRIGVAARRVVARISAQERPWGIAVRPRSSRSSTAAGGSARPARTR